jgi:xeroderma pigmentosum group C-complementing protein
MSFNWNLESDNEEEEDIEKWTKQQGFLLQDEQTSDDEEEEKLQPTSGNPAFSLESEEEDLEWEDAEHYEISDSLQPVTIDFNATKNKKEQVKRKVRKRREKFRFESLPPSQQSLLRNLHRAHLLTMTSRAVLASSCCASEEVLAIALSLIPARFCETTPPPLNTLESFMTWFSTWVGGAQRRRHERAAANRRAGAPRSRRRLPVSPEEVFRFDTKQLLQYTATLSNTAEEDPQLFESQSRVKNSTVWNLALFIAMTRSLGWRTRFVQAIDPISLDLTVHHPLMSASPSSENMPNMLEWTEIYCCFASPKKGKRKIDSEKSQYKWIHADPSRYIVNQPQQVEALWKKNGSEVKRQKITPGYVVAVEHAIMADAKGTGQFQLTDVTARYASSWVEALRQRGFVRGKKRMETDDTWWLDTIRTVNGKPLRDLGVSMVKTINNGKCVSNAIVLSDENEDRKPPAHESIHLPDLEHHNDLEEAKELLQAAKQEAIPTTKTAFRTSPLYVIPSLLGVTEVIDPTAKVCGFFKGERVYLRSDLSIARPARQWPYDGRRVKDGEAPIKKVKARKRPKRTKAFQALISYGVGKVNDGSELQRASILEDADRQAELDSQTLEHGDEEWLYAIWQTDPWSPPYVGPTDPIPVNEHRNVEKALLPPGLLHIELRGAAAVAKKLCIPYAPCLIGFEGHGGNRTPSISGIVVHEHNADLVREAMREVSQYEILNEEEKRRKAVLQRWKKIMVGLLLKERIEREYGYPGNES